MKSGSRFVEAFKENYNVVGLAAAVAASAALLNPLPLLIGVVAEAAYLIFVPDSKWYEQRLARKYDAEVEERRRRLKEQVLPQLRTEMQDRFARLEDTRAAINEQPMGDQTWFREVLRKLDYLLEKFLTFALKDVEFRSHLRSLLAEVRGDHGPGRERKERGRRIPVKYAGGPGGEDQPEEPLSRDPSDRWVQLTVREIQGDYDDDLAELRALMEQGHDESTKAVLEKRMEVLQRRHDYVGKMGKILINLNHQLKLLEDTFGLINDEIRARSPEQVLSDIEDVVWQTNSMTQLLEEIAPYEQMTARLVGG